MCSLLELLLKQLKSIDKDFEVEVSILRTRGYLDLRLKLI